MTMCVPRPLLCFLFAEECFRSESEPSAYEKLPAQNSRFSPLDTGPLRRATHLVRQTLLYCAVYVTARMLFPQLMVPGGKLWSLLLVWVTAYNAGELVDLMRVPKSVGMLAAGLILVNLPAAPDSHLPLALAHLSSQWGKDIRAAALALVLLRAGLGIDLAAVRRNGLAFYAMAVLPSAIESVVGAGIATSLFGMPYVMALGMAFVISAASPSIITTSCLLVKERGYSHSAPNFLMLTTVFDDAICIIGANCLLFSYIPTNVGNRGYNVAHGPLNAILGVTGGCIAAFLLSATALWNTPSRRACALFLLAMGMIFTAGKNNFPGAGADASLIFGLLTRWAWQQCTPRMLASAEHQAMGAHVAMLREAHMHLKAIWEVSFYPLLFGLIGATLSRRSITSRTGRLAVIYATVTCCVRVLATAAVVHLPTFTRRFSRRERVFLCCAFLTKATVQAAFATLLGDLLKQWVAAHPGELFDGHTAAELAVFGDLAKWASVISIFISVPIGSFLMLNGAPYLLDKHTEEEDLLPGADGAPDDLTADDMEALSAADASPAHAGAAALSC